MFVSNKLRWVKVPLKPSSYGKFFMPIQSVLYVWEPFDIQNPNIFGLQRTLVAYFFFIECSSSINKNWKNCTYQSRSCSKTFHTNPKSYQCLQNILVGGSTLDGLQLLMLLLDHFRAILQTPRII